jgi:PAS domain S-box-containing protein
MEVKFRSQAFIALNKVTVHLQAAQKTIVGLGRRVIDKSRRPQEARRTRENDLRKLLANSLDAIVVANGKITRFKSHTFIALNKVMVHLQGAQKTIVELGRGAADKLQEARRTRENDLRKLLEISLDAIVVANGKITRFKSHTFIALNKVTVHLQRAQKTLTRFGRSVVDEPRRLQEARRTRENDLRKLLANSLDAIVVTDGDHRLVYANPKALDLFGVSELNMRKFTIDTFLSHCQILELRRKWFAIRRDERYGKCKISRLDGSLRVAEYIFVANFTSRQDLYRFEHVAPPGITQLRFSAKMPISYTEPTLGNQFGSSRSQKFPKSWLVN